MASTPKQPTWEQLSRTAFTLLKKDVTDTCPPILEVATPVPATGTDDETYLLSWYELPRYRSVQVSGGGQPAAHYIVPHDWRPVPKGWEAALRDHQPWFAGGRTLENLEEHLSLPDGRVLDMLCSMNPHERAKAYQLLIWNYGVAVVPSDGEVLLTRDELEARWDPHQENPAETARPLLADGDQPVEFNEVIYEGWQVRPVALVAGADYEALTDVTDEGDPRVHAWSVYGRESDGTYTQLGDFRDFERACWFVGLIRLE